MRQTTETCVSDAKNGLKKIRFLTFELLRSLRIVLVLVRVPFEGGFPVCFLYLVLCRIGFDAYIRS